MLERNTQLQIPSNEKLPCTCRSSMGSTGTMPVSYALLHSSSSTMTLPKGCVCVPCSCSAALYDPRTGKIAGLEPSHFITLATPHLGCDADGVSQV